MRVFVCDDDKDILEFIRILLMESGYEVMVTEECGEDMITTIKDYQPDVMVFDYWLKEGKSDKIISKIKEYKTLRSIPIILISAIAEADLKKVAKSIPIDDYMNKPFDIHDLIYKIRNTVQYA